MQYSQNPLPVSASSEWDVDLYQFVPVGCLVLNSQGFIEKINQTGAMLLGWRQSWLRGKSFERWIVNDDLKAFQVHLNAVKHSHQLVSQQVRIKTRQGRQIVVRLDSVGTNIEEQWYCHMALIDMSRGQYGVSCCDIEDEYTIVAERYDRLTQRERQVMTFVVSDVSNKEIARRLNVSPRTVEHHREHVMAKMEASSLHDLIIMAVICGVHELHI